MCGGTKMKYEGFVTDFISLLKEWGAWNDNVRIYAEDRCYDSSTYAEGKVNTEYAYEDCKEKLTENCMVYVELNSALNNLFEYGIYVTDLADLPLSKKQEAYYEREELRKAFCEEYDAEEIRMNPEEYGIPFALEFDSADEYEEFFQTEMHKLESNFIADLTGKIEYDNTLELEIFNLCNKYGLSYSFTGDSLKIGYYFY